MIQPDPAIDAIRDSFIASIPEELGPETEAPVETAELEAAPADPVEPSEPAAEAPAAVEVEKPSEARAYRKLLDGEAKLRAERKAYEEERKSHEAELAQFRAIKDKVKVDPIGYLIATGLTDKEILEAMQEAHARDLGVLAPPEVRAQLAAKRAERLANETEAKVEARLKADREAQQAAAGQAFVAQYQQGITNFVATGLNEFPQLAAIHAAGKPVAQAMYQTAVEMAQANPTGDAPTYADVAKQLNAQLLELASYVAPAPTATATTPDPQTPAKPVLRNSSTQAQPSPAADTKPKSYQEYTEELRSRVLPAHGIAVRR
jgi:hypothetical protein